jgi:four helix bundle protein
MKTDLNYSSLPVWEQMMEYVRAIYQLTGRFPGDEKDGLTRKLRDKAVEIPVLFASGTIGKPGPESKNNLVQASQALIETETLLLVCKHLAYVQDREFDDFKEKILSISKELYQLSSKINRNFK